MDHWKGLSRDREHNAKAWQFVRALKADIVLLQEAVPPPAGFDATVFPPPDDLSRWDMGGRAKFGAAVAVFGHDAREIPNGPIAGDRSARLVQSHPSTFVATRVRLGEAVEVTAVSLYGMMEGPLMDRARYAVTTTHRALSDLTPLLMQRSAARILGGDFNCSTQLKPPDREHHRVVFQRLDAFGLEDCTRKIANRGDQRLEGCSCADDPCRHVQTHRHNLSKVPWQLDYLFASQKQLGTKLAGCALVDTADAWALSDHCPVVAEFDV